MLGDLMKKAAGLAGKAGDLGEVKDDVLLLRDEAKQIMAEIEELQKIAASLMARQKKVIDAIVRLKKFADGGSSSLMDATK